MIDCHAHLWDPAQGFGWIRPGSPHHRPYGEADLARSGTGVDGLGGAILVEAARGDTGETGALRALRLRRPDLVAGYVGNLHVHGEEGPDRFRGLLEEWGATGPNGMRMGGSSLTDTPESARALIPVLEAAGLVLELNLHHGAPAAASDIADRHPALTVVVDHLGNPPNLATGDPGEWYRALDRAASAPNVLVKISGLLTQQHGVAPERVADLVRHVVGVLGPDRCLVGSDWPICLPRGTRADSLALSRTGLDRLTEPERERVLHGNAVRAYRLSRTGRARSC
ncbi:MULTISPECIES: amidohydrolase family protein [unclassified Streptomyces]|uniref:amidohydrolase family protein n=1 Tax=unclassified Streptomyces TaxID=2593676 RepID=UPI000DC36FF3|nr:amidohydrolase family protein [Streptomyces sp. PsTaAH-137]MYT73857.1 amidohydrolase family protein [Streptomyces sp. SID8367]RAJ89270.1 L-fuconolactonase [Streptomyces sp. PsTaAH-137]